MSTVDSENTENTEKDSVKDDQNDQEQKNTVEKLVDKIKKLTKENKDLKQLKPKNSDDIAPGIRTQDTFKGGYRNGLEDGSVEKFEKEQLLKQKT